MSAAVIRLVRVAARFALAALMSRHYEANTTTRVVSDQLGRHKGGGFEGKGEQGGSNPPGGASHRLPLTSDLGQCPYTLSSSSAAAAPALFGFLFYFILIVSYLLAGEPRPRWVSGWEEEVGGSTGGGEGLREVGVVLGGVFLWSKASSKRGYLWTFDPQHFIYLQKTYTRAHAQYHIAAS